MQNETASPIKESVANSGSDVSVLVKNDFLKFLYAAMLHEFPVSTVREFWDRHGSQNELSDLYSRLWQENAYSSVSFFLNVLESVEPFFIEKGINPHDFINTALLKINKGLLMSAKSMLLWSSPFLEYYYTTKDLRNTILDMVGNYTSMLFTGLYQGLIQHTKVENRNRAILIMMITGKSQPVPCNDRKYLEPLPPFDSELWTASFVRTMPVCMQLQPFEDPFFLADSRKVQYILPGIRKDGICYYDGNRLIGMETSFHDFCLKNMLISEITDFNVPDTSVVEITDNYYCSTRKRVILHKGCVYGAPVCLYGFNYYATVNKPDNFLSAIIKAAVEENNPVWNNILKKHYKLLREMETVIHCIYHVQDENVTINGKHFVSSVPARILSYILKNYAESNQTEYEYREIIKNVDLLGDPEKPNLNVRIKRLSDMLESSVPFIKIIKVDRGKFLLDVKSRLKYTEIKREPKKKLSRKK